MSDRVYYLERQLEELNKKLLSERANAKMFKQLYMKHKPEVSWCRSCPKIKRVFCWIPCGAELARQGRV